MIEIILTVCAIAHPTNCEEKYLQFAWEGSINQCMMAAQPYIAEWIGRHPEWMARKWSCDYPGSRKRAIWFGLRRASSAALLAVFDFQLGPKATPQGNSPT